MSAFSLASIYRTHVEISMEALAQKNVFSLPLNDQQFISFPFPNLIFIYSHLISKHEQVWIWMTFGKWKIA